MDQTPLHAAASGGSYPVVKLLLDARVKIDSMDTNGVSCPETWYKASSVKNSKQKELV